MAALSKRRPLLRTPALATHPPQKWGCFTCASPFSCRQRPSTAGTVGSDGEGEVVRRNASPGGGHQEEEEEGEEFVIRRQASYLSLVADGSPGDVARASAGRPK